ncbi:MAG: AtpZ/AtpI family protein [Lachnospira sp.]
MGDKGKGLRNIVLISQISICIMVPTFVCLALGIWLDKKFGTWFTIPLLFIGMAAGARNAYVLAINTIKQEETSRKRKQEEEIKKKVENYNKIHDKQD